MKHFLYLRGNPGVGKITVAKLLERDLGWRVFWFHDLKNAVFNIVQEHRIPRLMDAVTAPVTRHLLASGKDVIFVRPSPDKQTVDTISSVVKEFPEYAFHPVRLAANYETLLARVNEREDPYRIQTKAELDKYLSERETAEIEGELIVGTDNLTPEQVAAKVLEGLGLSVGSASR